MQVTNEKCALCLRFPEDRDHLFSRCEKSKEVRRVVNSWWNVLPSNCDSFEQLLDDDDLVHHKDRRLAIKGMVKIAYMWAICIGRNDALFNNVSFNPLITANVIQRYVYHWLRNRSSLGSSIDWFIWLCNPKNFVPPSG